MLNDLLLEKDAYIDPKNLSEAVCWVIDEEVLYTLLISKQHLQLFLDATEFIDVSSEYPEWGGITVRLMNNENVLEIFQTSEYLGSVLLSSPKIINLSNHKYGRYVVDLGAKFINFEFVIFSKDVSNMPPWYPNNEPETDLSMNCATTCQCRWYDYV